MSLPDLHSIGTSSHCNATAPDAMSTVLAQLELAQRACQTATGKKYVAMSIVHWAACSELVGATRPLSFGDLCLACGYDFNCSWLKPVLAEMVRDGLVAKVRRPPTPTDPKGRGHRYMATHHLRMAARFLAADFKPAD